MTTGNGKSACSQQGPEGMSGVITGKGSAGGGSRLWGKLCPGMVQSSPKPVGRGRASAQR